LRDYERGVTAKRHNAALKKLLLHCRQSVPYYSEHLRDFESVECGRISPAQYLQRLPILTKALIRADSARLQSVDLGQRKWSYNTSGGSTGEPVRLIQDAEYTDCSAATSMLFHGLLGCDVGRHLVRLWGSERDILEKTNPGRPGFLIG